MAGTSLLVMGDQLNRGIGALAQAEPSSTRILMVESAAKVRGRPWHRQRLHLIITAMRRFAEELEAEGFTVDYRQAPSFAEGIAAHVARHRPELLLATEPNSRTAEELLRRAAQQLLGGPRVGLGGEQQLGAVPRYVGGDALGKARRLAVVHGEPLGLELLGEASHGRDDEV